MQCSQFEEIVAQAPDGGLPAAAVLHLQSCDDCRLLWDDLRAIQAMSQELGADEPAPPERLWTSLRAQLEAEGLVRAEKPAWSFADWFSRVPRLAPAGGYAAVLVAGSLLASSNVHHTASTSTFSAKAHSVTSSPLVSELDNTLDGNIKRVIASFPERDVALVDSFQHNLGIVNDLIAVCEKSVREQPDNPVAREYLYGAYQQKAVLLATAMDRSTMEVR